MVSDFQPGHVKTYVCFTETNRKAQLALCILTIRSTHSTSFLEGIYVAHAKSPVLKITNDLVQTEQASVSFIQT